MPVETSADIAMMLSADDWGTAVSYTPVSGGAPRTINGIFDAAAKALEVGLEVQIASTGPQLTVATADLSEGGRQGDVFIIGDVTYRATDVQPDGTGVTLVQLERQ